MRVLMITPGFYPIKGGTETMVRSLAAALNNVGVSTDIMTFNMNQKWNTKWRGETERVDQSTVYRIPAINWLPHSGRINFGINVIPGRIMHILKEYDILHFHELDLSFPFFAFFARKPKIFHCHGVDVDFYKRYPISRFIFKNVAGLYISLTRRMSNELVELGIPRSKIFCLPNAVDAKLFHPQGEKEDDLLLFVGRISIQKGLHVLLESLRYLKRSCRLVIIGPAGLDKYSQDMLKLVEKENQKGKHKIEYLGALENIIKWYQKASICVLPSFWEAFSVVMLEALSCETPVIATNVGGIPEVIRNHEHGILVPPNNPPKLAEAIQFLLDNKDARTRMGKEGRKLTMKNFSLEASAKILSGIYQEVISR